METALHLPLELGLKLPTIHASQT